MSDLHPQAAVPGELVHQPSPLIQLVRRRQQESAAACEQSAEKPGEPRCGMSRHWWRIRKQVISPRGGRCRVSHPGIVGVPAEPFEARPDGRLEMEVFEGCHMVKLSPIAPVDIPRPWTNFSPDFPHLTSIGTPHA
jgi:hypothetical protein